MNGELLRVEGITKRFPGVAALDNVHFEVRAGEVHGLIGENGAGKSTLVNVLAGSFPPDSGRILWRGKPAVIQSPHHARALGIRTVFQNLSLVPQLTVVENLFLGRELTAGGLLRRSEMVKRVRHVLERIGEPIDPMALVRDLSPPQRYLVEIAKAIMDEFALLILDEPTASLTARETERLFSLVREMVRQGKGVVWITHRLEELEEIADRITVMRDGRYIATVPAAGVGKDQLITYMTGKEYKEVFPPLASLPPVDNPVLEVTQLHTVNGLSGITFALGQGEVLGVGGLIGAGKSELGRALFGLEKITAGNVRLFGRQLPARALQPSTLIRAGVMYFPADRRGEGLVLCRSVGENMTLAALEQFERLGFLDQPRERQSIHTMVRRFDITPPQPRLRIAHLSGGNQQKTLLAKGVVRPTRLFILDEPTQGIDVGAKIGIYQFIHQLAAAGAAVLLISSDLLELMNLCHRVLVLYRGRVAATVAHGDASEERLLRHYFGDVEERVHAAAR